MAIRRARRYKEHKQKQVPIEAINIIEPPESELDLPIEQNWITGLIECFKRLTDRARGILKLHYGLDQSYSDIGQRMGISKQAVGKTVQKSIRVLRHCLETHDIAFKKE